MGTALTAEQATELGNLAALVLLCLDADAAGQQAAVRAASVLPSRLELRVVAAAARRRPRGHRGGGGRRRADAGAARPRGAVRALPGRADARARARRRRHRPGPRARARSPASSARSAAGSSATTSSSSPPAGWGSARSSSRARSARAAAPARGTRLPSSGRCRAPANGARQALDRREQSERAFLALCIALPELGEEKLAEADLDARLHLAADPPRRRAPARPPPSTRVRPRRRARALRAGPGDRPARRPARRHPGHARARGPPARPPPPRPRDHRRPHRAPEGESPPSPPSARGCSTRSATACSRGNGVREWSRARANVNCGWVGRGSTCRGGDECSAGRDVRRARAPGGRICDERPARRAVRHTQGFVGESTNPYEREALYGSRGGTTGSLDSMREEARKCVLLCGNCHAEVEAGLVQVALPADTPG